MKRIIAFAAAEIAVAGGVLLATAGHTGPATIAESAHEAAQSYGATVAVGMNNAAAQAAASEEGEEPAIEWIDVTLDTPGTLGVEVLYKADRLSDVQYLKVHGAMSDSDWADLKNMYNLVSLDLSDAVSASIPAENFKGRTALKHIRLPKGLTTIGTNAFSGSGLVEFNVPDPDVILKSDVCNNCKSLVSADLSGVRYADDYIFKNCTNLTDVTLGVFDIPQQAFYQTNLKNVVIPEGIKTIGASAFSYCRNLESVQFPESLTTVGDNAFSNSGLKAAILPDNLSSLGSCFYYCQSLEDVRLPYKITTVPNALFNYCTSLRNIECVSATPPVLSSGTLGSAFTPSQITLKVPDFAVVNYKASSVWGNFGTIVGGATSNSWLLSAPLSLANDRRMEGTPDVTVTYGGQLSAGGNAPLTFGNLVLTADYYNNPNSFGQIINNVRNASAEGGQINIYTYYNRWYFLSLPCDVKVSEITHSAGADFVWRAYDGQRRGEKASASGNWADLAPDAVLKAGHGYIYQCSKQGNVQIPFGAESATALLASGDRAVEVYGHASEYPAHAGWNLVGNPYPCIYDLAASSLSCPIIVWNRDYSRYDAYSLLDDRCVIQPYEAFFFQAEEDGNVSFAADGRFFTQADALAVPRAPQRRAGSSARNIFNISLLKNNVELDRTRIVLNEEASEGYEPICDASKMFADEAAPAIWTIDAEGNAVAINERPATEAPVALAMTLPAGTYTLSMNRCDGNALLHDTLTGKDVRLDMEDYEFSTDGKDAAARFTIKTSAVATGVEGAQGVPLEIAACVEGLNVCAPEGVTVEIYTVSGIKMASYVANGTAETVALPHGLYIVKAGASVCKTVL